MSGAASGSRSDFRREAVPAICCFALLVAGGIGLSLTERVAKVRSAADLAEPFGSAFLGVAIAMMSLLPAGAFFVYRTQVSDGRSQPTAIGVAFVSLLPPLAVLVAIYLSYRLWTGGTPPSNLKAVDRINDN